MPSYKITKDSVKVSGNMTSMLVAFFADDGTESPEQYWEATGITENEIYSQLDSAAQGFQKSLVKTETPNLETDTTIEAGKKITE